MSKFDSVFNEAYSAIFEREYFTSTFQDNLKSLIKVLQNNDLLSKNIKIEEYVAELNKQPQNRKEILLDTKENSLPAIKLHVSQENDSSESFVVTVINLENPEEQKVFKNSMLETIFEDVIDHIQTIAIKGLSPDNAVQELPQDETEQTQPGAEETALPKQN